MITTHAFALSVWIVLSCKSLSLPSADKIEYRRKPRTDFTPSQRSVLLSAFEKNNHPGHDVTKELATKINVDETVIKVST